MSGILEFENVAREYVRGVRVLDGVSFSVREGEVVGLLGRNGAGKTTLIHIAMGILYPQGGSVRVFGLSPTDHAIAVKKRVGYVAEDQTLPVGSSIAELVQFYGHLFPDWDAALEREILERFQLSPKQRMGKLSKGQARAAALMLAVCHRPDLLILDEPAAGLDPAARREFLEVAVQFLNRDGGTILFSSHQMNDIERLGSRAVVLDGGKVRIDSDLDRLREDYCLAVVPLRATPQIDTLTRIPGYVRARPVASNWHALFRGAPEDVHQRLAASLGANGIRCERVGIEDFFIELVGGQHERERE